MEDQKINTAQNNLELLWKIIDERYCFFEEKSVDWNQVYKDYCRDRNFGSDFDPNSSWTLFETMTQMLAELRDGHVCLDNGDYTRCYSGWYSGYPENFSYSRIRAYINQDRNSIYLENGTSFSILPESIGYIRCPSFTDKFNRYDLDKAMLRFNGLKGVIIDVRNNGGGLMSEAYLLASKFTNKKTHVGYVRYKTGKGHNDFSDYFARYIEPEGDSQFHGKVAILTNRRVYSTANMFVSVMSNLPQVAIIGDHTGGGGGVPISAELYNGWSVKLSTNPMFDKQKRSIESGVKPNFNVELNRNNQIDNIIEFAKEWILAN